MSRSRPTLRVIRRAPPSVRLILAIAVMIGGAIGGIWGYHEDVPPPRSAPRAQTQDMPNGAKTLIGTVSVIDGDTLDLHGQRIRLHGIDAPESRQGCTRGAASWRCGQQASMALAERIGRQPLRCEQRDIDRYKRIVAVCYVGETNVNAWLISEGWAMAYRQYSKDYAALEEAARRRHIGIWQGEVQPPWDWRRQPKGKP